MKRKSVWFILTGLIASLVLAGVVSNFASGSPDGLDTVVRDGCTFDENGNITGGSCIAQREQSNQTDDSPLADYGIRGIDNEFLSTGLSGVVGVLLTFALAGALFWLARRNKGDGDDETEPAAESTVDSDAK
jgi:cobalt/nickel transport protein